MTFKGGIPLQKFLQHFASPPYDTSSITGVDSLHSVPVSVSPAYSEAWDRTASGSEMFKHADGEKCAASALPILLHSSPPFPTTSTAYGAVMSSTFTIIKGTECSIRPILPNAIKSFKFCGSSIIIIITAAQRR